MSSIQRINFEPVSDMQLVTKRSIQVADVTLLTPGTTTTLTDGEWVTFNSSGQLVRASVIGSVGNISGLVSFPVWSEVGRTDTRAKGEPMLPILFRGDWEFDSRVYDATAALGSGAAITTMLQPLKVATITIGPRNYTGLVGSAYADNDPIVGYVTRLPGSNGGKLRFISGWAVRNGAT